MKTIHITDNEIIKSISDWAKDCDADELAYFVGEIFGGNCEYNTDTEKYDFEPTTEYMGAFDHIK